jgi:hypothetical protein
MNTSDDGLSSPIKRRRNGGNLIEFFKIENSKKHCIHPNCSKSYSLATSTTDLMYHLRSEHKIILIDKNQADEEKTKNSNSALDPSKQEQIDALLIKLLANKNLNITMSESFCNFIHAVQPNYIIPDEAIIKQKLSEISEKLKPKIDDTSIDSD